VIHRYWSDLTPHVPEPAGNGRSVEWWHPGELHDWHDDEVPDEIMRWCRRRWDAARYADLPRHQANMVRWWLLWEHGGTWLDHDVILHARMPAGEWVGKHHRLSGEEMGCASMISLPPKHELMRRMLDHCQTIASSNLPCPRVSGSMILTRHAMDLSVPFVDIDPFAVHLHATSNARLKVQ
jgi:hypothetical protein